MSLPFFKIVVLGEGRVGKTSISLKFVQNTFSDAQQSTINASYLQKQISLNNGKNIVLAIWDTAGQEKYNAIVPVYYRDALGAVIVYDITSAESFDKVKKWTNQLRQHADKNVVIYIAGNKSDMNSMRKISEKQVQEYCHEHGLKHFNVSAKTGDGINNLFQNLCEDVMKSKDENGEVRIGGKKKKAIRIEQKDRESKLKEEGQGQGDEKKKCC